MERLEIVKITKDNSIKATFRQGDRTYAVGESRFYVIDWTNHQARTFLYVDIDFVTAASNGSAFTDLISPQSIDSIEINLSSGDRINLFSDNAELSEFYNQLVITRQQALGDFNV